MEKNFGFLSAHKLVEYPNCSMGYLRYCNSEEYIRFLRFLSVKTGCMLDYYNIYIYIYIYIYMCVCVCVTVCVSMFIGYERIYAC